VILAAASLTISPLHSAAQESPDNASCFECHAEPDLTKTGADGTEISLTVTEPVHRSSVHGEAGLACTDCHAGIAELPHEETLPPVDCSGCHADAGAVYGRSVHAAAVGRGNKDAPTCAGCHGKHDIRSSADPASPSHRLNQPRMCAVCHSDPAVVARNHIPAEAPLEAYMKSVHGNALLVEKSERAPTCATCHGAHEILEAGNAASRVHKTRVPETCGACHAEEAAVFKESVHGIAVSRGNPDAPACNDCHGEHQIEGPSSPASFVYPATLVETTCARCHESQILAQRYGFRPDRATTFQETYHGLATKLGGLPVANCASCHGVHNIFPSTDARSTVNPANLQATCGHCHPSASEAFTRISVHQPATLAPRHPIVRFLRSAYMVLIAAVIGGMFFHNLLIWGASVARKYRLEKARPQVARFSRFEAAEHFLLIIAFFGLVITGFALKYSGAEWVRWMTRLGLDEEIRRTVHRGLGVVLIALGLAHLAFLSGTRRGRQELAALRVRARDLSEVLGTLAYYIGKRAARPMPGRFSYAEKAEYLALIWGTAVMALTGLVLWFPTVVTRWAPSWLVEAAEVVHFYEAWLAFLAILVWHLFFVIFHPDEYPLDLTFLHGKVTREKAEEREWAPDEEARTGPRGDAEEEETPKENGTP
jgi:cytochrome b subunit of formate dehydrogenase